MAHLGIRKPLGDKVSTDRPVSPPPEKRRRTEDKENRGLTKDKKGKNPVRTENGIEYEEMGGRRWIAYRVGTTLEDAKPVLGRLTYFDPSRSRIVVAAPERRQGLQSLEEVWASS